MPLAPRVKQQTMVGRDGELAELRAFLERTATQGEALVVTGDPGIGKSTLLASAADLATGRGAVVLRAAGVEVEMDLGFAGLHQLLTPCRSRFGDLDSRHRDALEVCLGVKAGASPLRPAVVSATLALLGRLSHDRQVLVAVDDLQWLDRASATVLTTVARSLENLPVGLVGALRAGSESFFDRGALTVIHLEPLPAADATILLERRAPDIGSAIRARLLDEARGNPLALMELSLHGRSEDDRVPAQTALPGRLQSLFAPRIRKLPAGAREFLLLTALDSSGDLRVIRAAAGRRVSDVDLRTCEQSRLVIVDKEAGTVRFRHPLVRSAAISLATGGERRHAHRALGEVDHVQVERRAQHLADGSLGPDEATARLLEEGAQALLRRGDATGTVSMLLRSAELSPHASERARRLALGAYVGAALTGDLDRVAELLAQAHHDVTAKQDSVDAAVAAAFLLLNGDGDVETAHRLLVGALRTADGIEATSDATLVEALFTLLMICFFSGRADLWEPFFVELKRLEPAVPLALDLCARTFATPASDGGEALDDLRTAIAALPHEADPMQVVRIATAAFYPHELEGCLPALWRVVNEDVEHGAVTSAINAWILLAFHAFLDGQWDDAGRYARRGVDLSEARGYRLLAWPGRYCLALVAAARGEDSISAAASDDMLRWAQPRGVRSVMAYAQHTATLAALGHGDFEAAYRHASSVTSPGVLDPHLAHGLWLTMDLVEAAAHTNRHAEADAHVQAMRTAGVSSLSSRYALLVASSEAMVAADADALRMFECALTLPGVDRWPFELARVQLLFGERLRRARQQTRAREQLLSAREAFDLLRASPWCSRADRELQRLAAPRRGAAAAGLTARESEVAALAASGLTNSQIAARLGASSRTVAAHLSHVFAKLSIGSRAGLRDALTQRGPGEVDE